MAKDDDGTTSSNRGGPRPGSGPKPKFARPVRLSVNVEGELLDRLDVWRRDHPAELVTVDQSLQYPESEPGTRPRARSDVVTDALEQYMDANP
jgi:hypothetical protein